MNNNSKYQKFFAEQFQDRWLSFECFDDYFTETLCTLTPDTFNREQQKWNDEKIRLLNEQKNLAFKNYRSFVSTAECSNKIRASFNEIELKLDGVCNVTPDLQNALNTCLDVANTTTQQRREVNISITKHPQLLEILELPQLIDTSIRNNFFDEGLELHNYVLNLSAKYNDIEIIQKIREDANICIKNMEEVLLKQLQNQINLANCLKNVGLLRRIGTYNENQLKTKFLHLRTQWFKTTIRQISREEVQYYMCKMIDSYRVNLFDIITQYRSVFIEDKNNSLIFNFWLHQQIKDFIELLYVNLPSCNGTVLDSVIAQSMYFGMSLGRVGADFRGLLVPIFQRNILNTCNKVINNATSRFKDGQQEIMEIKNRSTGGLKLIKLTPLALYTNTLLSMLNDLRHCSPSTLNPAISTKIEVSLTKVLGTVAEVLSLDGTFKDDVCNCIVLEMLPLLDNAITTLFSSSPSVYNQSNSSSRSTLKLKRGLNLRQLHKILEDYISKPTKIMLGNLNLDNIQEDNSKEIDENTKCKQELVSDEKQERDKKTQDLVPIDNTLEHSGLQNDSKNYSNNEIEKELSPKDDMNSADKKSICGEGVNEDLSNAEDTTEKLQHCEESASLNNANDNINISNHDDGNNVNEI